MTLIEGYADRTSYEPGETVSVACRTRARTFSAEISRVGATRQSLWRREGIRGGWQDTPPGASEAGCGWDESFAWTVPPGAPSGYYEIVLRAFDERDGRISEGLAMFVVRPTPATRRSPILLVLSTNTYNAYNDWGGPSLYTGATRASFRRPLAPGFLRKPEPHVRYPNVTDIDDPEHEHFRTWADGHGLARWSGSAGWHNWERVFVRWAEQEGYQLDVAVNADLEHHPDVLDGHSLYVSVGHDEYWSWGMRDVLEGWIAAGGNAAFFSGNAVCWQVRYEDGGSTMVCYKAAYRDDPLFGTEQERRTTTQWCSAIVGRPENHLTGVSFSRGGYIRMGRAVPRATGGYTVWRPEHWALAGTGLRYGDALGTKDMVAVYEVDGCELDLSPEDGRLVPTGRDGTPGGFTVLATAPARLWSSDELPSRYRSGEPSDLEWTAEAVFGEASAEHIARLAHNHAVMGTYTRGGTVFTAGVTDWAYGLGGHDHQVERITRNVVDRLAYGKA
ncbi:MAG: N,N-dimethylformamidase beta subunit family domain-containing protein [Acidimicrobiales bacterium]